MKNTLSYLIILFAILCLSESGFTQSAEGFKYQTVVRNTGSGTVVNNQSIGLRFRIMQGGLGGVIIYTETHSTTTDLNGFTTLIVGAGISVDDFSAIDWSNGPYFIETSVDVTGGANYTEMSNGQLMSVPYAFRANTTENVISDNVDDADNDPTNEIETWSTLAGIPADIADGDDIDDADNDPTNEIETWSTLAGIPADIADGDDVDDADNDPANEIETWSTMAGIPADILDGDDVVDADNDPTNEIETWSTLAGIPADIADGDDVDDADNDPANEIETWSTMAGIPADILDGDDVDDADSDPTNEIETWSTMTGIPADIADGDAVSDADSDPTNEIENWSTMAGIPADMLNGDDIDDADNDPTNELELPTNGIEGEILTLNGAGNPIWEKSPADLCNLEIGDTYGGGIIFYIDASGCHGLVAVPVNQGQLLWGDGFEVPGADGTAIGTGNQNTIDIVVSSTVSGTAAEFCLNLVLSGYDDWFLPSKDELNLMYQNIGQGNALGLGNIGGFTANFYWSSTENGTNGAWEQNFASGLQDNYSKVLTLYVRAVRAF